ncbi:amidohydrolase [Brevibacillus laterosporus]|uniref:M20 metallopeptidase family protein n=1 Tax=Brevibacillus laterosporus TaxID=1465 RepID=UPI002406D45C|nr:M20 family metallopeptidase [Brevibacillus laterosporus]MDF9412167.1 amidohydrolase [Brevibacillus laterosporus]
MTSQVGMPLGAYLKECFTQMVEWRRHFHQYPELSFKEENTPAMIASILREMGLDQVREKVGGRGVVGTLIGGKPGKTVAIRADFDALPIQDQKDVEYKSKIPGVMHACGHDGHTAGLLGLASVLAQHREEIPGTIVFLFQFAEEENPGGATYMVQDGAMDGVDAVFGAHLWADFPYGSVGIAPGPVMANADDFTIKIQGRGGHGAIPHQTVDSIVIGSQIVNNIQTIASRNVDPLESVVVTIGTFNAGDNFNVIADSCKMTGTLRTFLPEIRDLSERRLKEIVEGTATMMGGTAVLDYDRGYPAVINTVAEAEMVRQAAISAVGEEGLIPLKPTMGGEDFSYYLQKAPGAFVFIGARNEEIGACYPHHHPRFDIDERAMLVAAEVLGRAALAFLHNHQG